MHCFMVRRDLQRDLQLGPIHLFSVLEIHNWDQKVTVATFMSKTRDRVYVIHIYIQRHTQGEHTHTHGESKYKAPAQ